MYNKRYALLAILLGSVAAGPALISAAFAAPSITVQTDKTSYSAGDTIKITGKVTDTTAINQPILIQILDPAGGTVKRDEITAAADGSYTYQFPSGGQLMNRDGTYNVTVTYKGTATAQTTFQFKAGAQGQQAWKTFTLNAAGKSYQIQYIITNGTVKSMAVDQKFSTLTVNITSTGDGNIQLKLPRNVIDARAGANGTSGADTDFTAFLDSAQNVAPDESTTPTADMRQISIAFPAGSQSIQIQGTTAVPEFGAIAAIVLGIAIVGIIVATARYNNKLNFPRL